MKKTAQNNYQNGPNFYAIWNLQSNFGKNLSARRIYSQDVYKSI